jgi:hypothetical protein
VQTLFGPVAGTALIMYLENVLSAKTPAWRLIEGLIFVAMIVFLPRGVIGTRSQAQEQKKSARCSRARCGSRPRSRTRCSSRVRRGIAADRMSIIETFGLGKLFGHFAANSATSISASIRASCAR